MNRLKLIVICLLNANVNYTHQVHHCGFRNRIWPIDDLLINNTRDNQFLKILLFPDFLFVLCCKFPSFRRHSPICPVDREPLSRDKVMISHVFILAGHAN